MENGNKKYEEFKQALITRMQEDLEESKQRLDAHIQENNVEAIAFEKGKQDALVIALFDINDLDSDYYENQNITNDDAEEIPMLWKDLD